jgi:hypothetical protein
MDDRQPSKRRKLAAEQMEKDLNRSSLRQRGLDGRPFHDESPRTTPFVEPTTIQPLPSNEPGPGASTARQLRPQRGTLPLSQTPQRATSTTGHPILACEVPTPRGMSMGKVMGDAWPPISTHHWSTITRLPPGRNGCTTTGCTTTRGRPRGRRLTGTHTAVHFPAPEAPVFGRPSTAERERASPPRPLNESRASWRGWSVTWWP